MSIYTIHHKKGTINIDKLEDCPPLAEAEVSIILPTYNEEGGIFRLIKEIAAELHGKNFNILGVDDESKDKTQSLVLDAIKMDFPVYLVSRKKKGVFSAQMDGAKLANSKIIIFMDADFSHPPKTIPQMLEYIPKKRLITALINLKKRLLPNGTLLIFI